MENVYHPDIPGKKPRTFKLSVFGLVYVIMAGLATWLIISHLG